jgi:hypothetical protein
MFVNAASKRNSAKNGERPFQNYWQMNHLAQTNSVQLLPSIDGVQILEWKQ